MKNDNVKIPVITDFTGKYAEDALAKLTPAKVKTYKADKGFGFLDTPTGDVFFHVTRYVALKIDLTALTQSWETPRGEDGKVVVTPAPKPGDKCLIRVALDKNGRSVADIWTYQKQVCEQVALLYDALQSALSAVKALHVLELETVTVTEGEPYADNARRTWVTPQCEKRETVFKGTNVSALLKTIGFQAHKAKNQTLFLVCYDTTNGRERIPLPACPHLECPI
jgi:hypothetical protein